MLKYNILSLILVLILAESKDGNEYNATCPSMFNVIAKTVECTKVEENRGYLMTIDVVQPQLIRAYDPANEVYMCLKIHNSELVCNFNISTSNSLWLPFNEGAVSLLAVDIHAFLCTLATHISENNYYCWN